MTKENKPYGCWPSVISSERLTQGICHLNEPQLDGSAIYWLESRPEEKGRTSIIRQTADGQREEITPSPINVRTRIHEYGGASYRVHHGDVYFVDNQDQRIYHLGTNSDEPRVLTPSGHYRYADFCIDEQRKQLICVCEIHKDNQKEPENCIISVNLDGSSVSAFNVLVFGNDFYSNPRVSPDGEYLSWLTWKHPYMPWDNSECWIAQFSGFGLLQKQRKVAGGSDDGSRQESVFQPQWSPNGELFYVSDKDQWWNIYRYQPNTLTTACIHQKEAEFATPQWVFGMSTYGFLNSYTLFCCYTEQGTWKAATIDTLTQRCQILDLPYTNISSIHCNDESDTAAFIGANEQQLDALVLWQQGNYKEITQSGDSGVDREEFSLPEVISFKNQHQQLVHGFYYAPQNTRYAAEEPALPPLLVVCHGGPTGATRTSLNLKIQYWTNRGFAVFDINYSGSTGYGRAYRDRLKENWGILDVDDICAGAEYLVASGYVNPEQVAVRGSSAGGYTVLSALTFRDTFKAGASLYGIGDLTLLAEDTHKFESRYLDQLVGPYPQEKSHYEARSPIHHIERLQCPVIFLQGLEDKVVPPNQAETMVNALVEKSIPVAYVTFEEEGHGFRQADNIRYALDVEYAFYSTIFDFTVEETLPAVPFMAHAVEENE